MSTDLDGKRKSTRVKGHALAYPGATNSWASNGAVRWSWAKTGSGMAKCQCGELSPVLPSAAQRKQWHREHKARVRGEG